MGETHNKDTIKTTNTKTTSFFPKVFFKQWCS